MVRTRKYSLVIVLFIVITLIGYPMIRNATAAEGMWTLIKNVFGGKGDVMTDTLTLRGATSALQNVVMDSTSAMKGYRYMTITISPTTVTGTIDASADSAFVRQIVIRGWADNARTALVGYRDLWKNQKVCNVGPRPLPIKDVSGTGFVSFYTAGRADSCTRIARADSLNMYPYFDIWSSGGSSTGHGAAFKVWVTGYN